MHAVLTLTAMLDHWEQNGRVAQDSLQAARAFLAVGR
jgi:hypothetical protein